MSFNEFVNSWPGSVRNRFQVDELRTLLQNPMQGLMSSKILWLKPCFFRFENKNNTDFNTVVLNGSATDQKSAHFWKEAIVNNLRAVLRNALDPSLDNNLRNLARQIDNDMQNVGRSDAWPLVLGEILYSGSGREVRCRIDRLIPKTISFSNLYKFIDHFYFLLPHSDSFNPVCELGNDLSCIVKDIGPDALSAVLHVNIQNDYTIEGMQVDCAGKMLSLTSEPEVTAITVANGRSSDTYDVQTMSDKNFRDMLFSGLCDMFFPWDLSLSLPTQNVFRQLVSAYVIGIANQSSGMLLRHVFNDAGKNWMCRIGISLRNGPHMSIISGENSIREDPWRILGKNIRCNSKTTVVTWEKIPKLSLAPTLPIRDVMAHFLCETFLSSAVLDVDSAYVSLYRDRLETSAQLKSMKLMALWGCLCSMYDLRENMFEKNMQRLAVMNRPTVAEMMAQVVAKDPVAFNRALSVFVAGQSVFGGGSERGYSVAAVPNKPTYDKLKSLLEKKIPFSSRHLMETYIENEQWKTSKKLRFQ